MIDEPMKVLYIAGAGRTGSTLLGRLLGEIPGFLPVGEAARALFSTRMLDRDLPCGCGQSLPECPFWGKIVANIDAEARAFGTDLVRTRYLPLLLAPLRPPSLQRKMEALGAAVRQMYAEVAERTACSVIVDSSKHPCNASVLGQVEGIELSVLHVVRDPRAVVNSWRRPKHYLRRQSPGTVLMWWLAHNTMVGLVRPHTRHYWLVRYEDFTENPARFLGRIARTVTGAEVELGFLQGSEARVSPHHIVAGNPAKFAEGTVTIERQSWSLPWHLQAFVNLATLPWLVCYRYPLWVSGRRAAAAVPEGG